MKQSLALLIPPSIYAAVGVYLLSGHPDFQRGGAGLAALIVGSTAAIALVPCVLGAAVGVTCSAFARASPAAGWLIGSLTAYVATGLLLVRDQSFFLVSAPIAYVVSAWPWWFLHRATRPNVLGSPDHQDS